MHQEMGWLFPMKCLERVSGYGMLPLAGLTDESLYPFLYGNRDGAGLYSTVLKTGNLFTIMPPASGWL